VLGRIEGAVDATTSALPDPGLVPWVVVVFHMHSAHLPILAVHWRGALLVTIFGL
jgi:hypothetical protein